MACLALRYVPFRCPRRHISGNGSALLSIYFTPRGFPFSISRENEVLNSRRRKAGGRSADNSLGDRSSVVAGVRRMALQGVEGVIRSCRYVSLC